MSKRKKLENSIRNNTANVILEDFEALIKQYGQIKEGAKHPKAILGKDVLPYKRTNPVHRPYVVDLLEMIDNIK